MNPYANPGISRYLKSTASTTTSSSASNSPNSTPRLNPSNTSSLPSLSRSNSTSTLTNKSSNSNLATHDSDASLDRKQQQQQQQTSTSSIPKLTIPHFKSHERLQQSSNNLQSYNGFTHITSDTNSSLSCDDFFGTTQSNKECESKQSQELSPTSSSPLSTNNNFNTTNIKDAYSLNSSIHYPAQSSKDDPLNSDIELYKADDSLCPDNFIIQKTTSDISNNNNSLRNNSNSSYPRKYTSKLHEKLHGKKSNQKEQLFFEKKDTKPSEKSSNTKNPSKIAQSLKSTNVVCQSSKTASSIQSNAQTNNRVDNNSKLYSSITQNQSITEQEQQQQSHNDINSTRYINPITGSLNRDLDSSEYLPGSGIQYSEQQPQTAFSPEDYLDLITNMNPAQIKLLPFSVRRKVKAIIAGNATQADIQSVSQNLDSILHFSCSNNNSIKGPSSTSCSPNHELLSPSNSGLNLAIDGSVQEDNNNIMQTQIISNSPHNISSSSSPFSSSSRRQSEDEEDGPLHILPQNISTNSNRFFSTGSPISPNTSLQNDSPYSPTTATTAAMNPRYSSGGTSIPSSPSFSSRRQLENKKRPFRSSTLSVYPSFNSIQRMRDASSSSSRPPTSDFFGTPVSRSSSLRIPQSSSSTNIYNNNNNNTSQSFGSYNSNNSFFGSSSLAKGGATPSPAMQFLSRFASAANSPSVSRRGSVVDGQLAASNDSSSSDLGEQVGDFIIGKQIAYGGFSQVKEAHTIVDGKPVVCAVKIMKRKLQNVKDLQTLASSLNSRNGDNNNNKNNNNNNESNLETANAAVEYNEYLQSQIDHEVILWRSLSHKNILKLLEVTETKDFTYCFADKISGGTLFDLVKDKYNVGLDTTQALGYAKQLADALLYLHETMHIVHRDVKLENCLIEPASPSNPNKINRLLLCDFGMSEYFVDEDMDKIDAELPPQLLEDDGEDDDDEDENDGDGDILMHDHKKIPKKVVGPAYTSSQMNQYHHHQSKSKHCNNNSSNSNQENQSNNNNTTPPQTESRESPNSMASSEDKSKQINTIMNRTESSSSISRQQQRSSRPTSRRNSNATNLSNPIMRSSSTVSLNRSALLPSAIGTTDNFGSFPYASPELLESELPIYDPSVDMWAFGVVLYALFMGRLPWNHPLLPILRELITKAEWSEQEVLDHVHSRFKTEIDEACSSSTNGDDENGGNSVSKFAKFLKSPDFARFEHEMNKNDNDNSTNNEKEEKAEDVMDYNMSEKQGVAAANSSSLSASSFFPTMETNTGGCDEMFNKMVESQSSPDNNNNPISKQKSDISSSSSSSTSSINKHNTNLAKYLTHGVVNLLHGCLSKDVGQRFTIRQVIDTKHLSMIE